MPRNHLAHADCLEAMASWPEDVIDLIFADPPYNIGFDYDGHYHDKLTDDEYVDWTCRWIDACARLLKPTGSFYVLIGDEYAAECRVHLKKLQREGQLLFRNWIVWHYTFGQRCKVKFNRSHAHLFYCVGSASVGRQGKPRADLARRRSFTFNHEAIAVPSARQTTYKDKRANPAGKLPDDTWYLKNYPDTANWYVRPQEASEDAGGGYFEPDLDTWYQSRLCGTFKERRGWHPCQLPEALLERIVKVSSNPGDLVFDPFVGSGTTLAVARRLGRDYLGCEQSEAYAEQALERIEGEAVTTA
ncbi:DNA adenine methyltransferase YhdJ [Mucisphaera calidilacus]|uniref:Methyltransferase n=2 Tax=Mucisphaera calidilacus TaxID=2527982 RepID=A0A518BTP8_9BACT|nr:DNA adenine methyltransferase YhdJ [Mucisphaera calidilacus]